MTTETAPSAEDIRAEVQVWLAENWDPELAVVEWRGRLADSGWACPHWPKDWYGRGLPVWAADVVSDEIARFGAVGLPLGGGMGLAAPTILEHGSSDLKRRVLRPTITGELSWCQLFSEPGNGSDLAGLTTRAELDGDEWVVNGQKVWNTSAHHADVAMLVARTNWDVPKHRGISYFVLPMHQPGVEVRPLKQMNGHASFNEVFMTDARVPADNLVGEAGKGWSVALTTLANERRFGTLRRPSFPRDKKGRAYIEAEAEAEEHFKTYEWYPQRAGRADLVIEMAQRMGVNGDPRIRQELAKVTTLLRTAQWTAKRASAARLLGKPPGAEGSIGKLAASHLARACAKTHSMIVGAQGLVNGPDSPEHGIIAEVLISVPAVSIAGGTDEIQRNILSERILGLPKEPSIDTEMPFRDVPRNPTRR